MELEQFKKQWIGKRVHVIGDHPHNGETGEVIDVKPTPVGMGMEVQGEWESFFVFSGKNIQVLKS